MRLQLITILVMAMLLVVFTFQNPHPVQMHFVGWGTKEFPVIGVILIAALAGVIISLLLGLKGSNKLKQEMRKLQRELDDFKTPPVGQEEEL